MQMQENANLFLFLRNNFLQWVVHAVWGLYNHQERARYSCHHEHLTSTSCSKMAAQVATIKCIFQQSERG